MGIKPTPGCSDIGPEFDRLKDVMNRKIRKGDAFPISRDLLLRHDSAAQKATVKSVKWATGGVSFVLPGAQGSLASSTIAW